MNEDDEESWFAADPGPLVRPFAITRGRAGRNEYNLDLITLVTAVHQDQGTTTLDWEYAQILRLCQQRPISIAELSAQLNLLLAAVKVLVSDLIKSGHLICRTPASNGARPDMALLEAVLDGVRRL